MKIRTWQEISLFNKSVLLLTNRKIIICPILKIEDTGFGNNLVQFNLHFICHYEKAFDEETMENYEAERFS